MRKHYQQLIEQEVLCEDKAQSNAVDELEKLSKQLLSKQLLSKQLLSKQLIATKKNEPIISGNLFSHYISKKTKPKATSPIKSLYFYGRVGRGKTMLMDLFYQYTPIKKRNVYIFTVLWRMFTGT
ncbi:AFG1/ZapE family ATPase [Colwellia maritima]|uniref:AFG1/ZapE family ATPase n=1 Tax=Colwellia maritima TaxID=2912588 RepID=UPI00237C3038|nr:AFG1/ZapE family ATPase [Colwellia maritima]